MPFASQLLGHAEAELVVLNEPAQVTLGALVQVVRSFVGAVFFRCSLMNTTVRSVIPNARAKTASSSSFSSFPQQPLAPPPSSLRVPPLSVSRVPPDRAFVKDP
jgi:hypothetical protein